VNASAIIISTGAVVLVCVVLVFLFLFFRER